MRAVLLGILAVTLAACATRPSPTELAVADDARCQSYGSRPGSPEYVECRSKFEVEHMADASRRRAAILASP
jgi:hypothetical protein